MTDPLPGHEKYRGMLAVPYLLGDGRPVSMRFRCMEDHNHRDFHHGKYMGLPDEPARPFNIGAIEQAGDVLHVAEGEFDTITLAAAGFHAVGLPGATNWTGAFRRLMAGFSRVWVWGDPDEAGAAMVARITRALSAAKGVRVKDGDVNETYIKYGAEGLRSLIEEGSSV